MTIERELRDRIKALETENEALRARIRLYEEEGFVRFSSPPLKRIVDAVAAYFHLTPAQILGKSRPASIAIPRMIAMALARKLTRLSHDEIGAFFDRTHGACVHSCNTVADLETTDPVVRNAMTFLAATLFSPNPPKH